MPAALICALGLVVSLVIHVARERYKRLLVLQVDPRGGITVRASATEAIPVIRARHIGAWLITLRLESVTGIGIREFILTVGSASTEDLRALRRAIRFGAPTVRDDRIEAASNKP